MHNALAAIGLAQVGPILEGNLGEGRETRLPLELPAGCTTVVAVGGDGVRDLDVTLLGPQGAPVAHDTTNEPQAVVRACFDAPDAYVLVVRAAAGAGSWVAATWEGGVGAAGPGNASASRAGAEPAGTCEAPIPLTEGVVTGTTSRGESVHAGTCAKNSARELVYALELQRRQRVTIEVEAHFDSVLYVRKDDCADEKAEVACNDDPPEGGRNQSRIEKVLDPGKYFVFVDGYSQEGGAFKMTVSTSDVLALAEACRRAPSLTVGMPASGTTSEATDDAEATCGGGAEGADAAWSFDLASRSRVRVVEHSDDMTPVVHVRRACTDPQSELACAEPLGAGSGGEAAVTGIFDAGHYTVFADARDEDAAGAYTLQLELAPPAGSGASGEGCGDAIPLAAGMGLTTAGDTFAARDDLSGSCGGAGAADVVYRLDVPRRSRFVAALQAEEAPHVLALSHHCGDHASEVACARAVDEVLSPGTYYLVVDGASPDAIGRFTLAWSLQDVTAQMAACKTAPTLVERRTLSATTAGAADKFSASCAGGDTSTTGPDRVFRFALASRATVRVTLAQTTFDGALVLRKACTDGAAAGDVAELACETASEARRPASIERTLEPGTYWVVVDGQSPTDQGSFSLDYRVLR